MEWEPAMQRLECRRFIHRTGNKTSMPTYEYQCQGCGERLEIFQKFSDKPLRAHETCGGDLQKLFHASGIVFKGSGYYVTDSRSNGKPPSTAKDSNGSRGSKDTKSAESKPKDTATTD